MKEFINTNPENAVEEVESEKKKIEEIFKKIVDLTESKKLKSETEKSVLGDEYIVFKIYIDITAFREVYISDKEVYILRRQLFPTSDVYNSKITAAEHMTLFIDIASKLLDADVRAISYDPFETVTFTNSLNTITFVIKK